MKHETQKVAPFSVVWYTAAKFVYFALSVQINIPENCHILTPPTREPLF
jgi:hypothetical protein